MFGFQSLQAQRFLDNPNLSAFKAESLTQVELAEIKSDLDSQGLTIDAVEAVAISRGMPQSEFAVLRFRLNSLQNTGEGDFAREERVNVRSAKQVEKEEQGVMVFGQELFTSQSLTFEPNQNMPAPPTYVVGPGDKLHIVLSGVQQFTTSSPVTSTGTVFVPNVGDISVGGLTLDAVRTKLTRSIGSIYTTLAGGGSRLSVTVDNFRSITVTIIGAKQPGNYNLSAMSTVYNALHLAGGPSVIGSYRQIELIRNNRVVRTIDLYRFLAKGDQSDNVALQDNDVIRIPSFKSRITLEGEVKRPGIYEAIPGETLGDIIDFASGFTDNAYKNRILVQQKTNSELKVTDLNENTYRLHLVQPGDLVTIDRILNRYENRVQIKGAVFRPGIYSLSPQEIVTVKDLIAKADGLRENALTAKASIIRQKEDLTTEYINVNLQAILTGDESENVHLKKEDILLVFFNQELLDTHSVSIDGEVREPGNYPLAEGKTLYDLLLEADYFTERAGGKITVYRTKISDEFNPLDPEKVSSFELNVDPANPEAAQNFLLEPMDRVFVRRVIMFETPEIIEVRGQVLYPGKYALVKKGDRVKDIIERSGGFSEDADVSAIKILRKIEIHAQEVNTVSESSTIDEVTSAVEQADKANERAKRVEQYNNEYEKLGDEKSSAVNQINVIDLDNDKKTVIKEVSVPINWIQVLRNPQSPANLLLEAADIVVIPKIKETVVVTGEVMFDTEVPYVKGKPLEYYLRNAGGVTENGWERKSYVVHSNGSANASKNFLGIPSYPDVRPGSKIIVPTRPEKKRTSIAEIATIGSILTSLAGVIIAIMR